MIFMLTTPEPQARWTTCFACWMVQRCLTITIDADFDGRLIYT